MSNILRKSPPCRYSKPTEQHICHFLDCFFPRIFFCFLHKSGNSNLQKESGFDVSSTVLAYLSVLFIIRYLDADLLSTKGCTELNFITLFYWISSQSLYILYLSESIYLYKLRSKKNTWYSAEEVEDVKSNEYFFQLLNFSTYYTLWYLIYSS